MVRPNYAGPPLLVSISLYVQNIPSLDINKHTGEMTIEMFYRQIWTDPRLKFDKALLVLHFFYCYGLYISAVKGTVDKIVGGEEIVDRIWVPDTYVYNEHSSQSKETYLSITSEGEVTWSQRLQLVFTVVSRNFINFIIL